MIGQLLSGLSRRVIVFGAGLLVCVGQVGPLQAEGEYVKGSTVLLKKVIVQKKTGLFDSPGAKMARTPVNVFSIYFVIKDAKNSDEWVRVGATKDKPVGWLKRKATIAWNTRSALYPVAPDGKRFYTIYQDPELKKEKAVLDRLPEGLAAISPVLDLPKDKKNPVYPVAFFAGDASPGEKRKPGERKPGVGLKSLQLEIVFVVDTTASMTPLIDGAKSVVGQIADYLNGKEFSESKGKVRLGLVEYQDATPGLKPSNLVQPLTGNISEFQRKLDPLKVAETGSVETEEDVLAGLMAAIKDGGWSKNSSKHIILLGDASAHLSGTKNTTEKTIEDVINFGRKTVGAESEKTLGHINFHSVRAYDESSDPDDMVKCRSQFREISRNNGEFEGEFFDVNVGEEEDKKNAIDGLVRIIRKGIQSRQKGATGGGRADPKRSNSEDGGAIARSIEAIFRSTTGIKLESVEKGFAQERGKNGRQVAHKKLLVSKVELKRLRSAFDFLHTQFETRKEPSARADIKEVLGFLQQAGVGAVSGQTVGPKVSLGRLVSALPFKSDALKKTAVDIKTMNMAEYNTWLAGIKRAKDRVAAILDTQKFLELSKQGGQINQLYTWLKLSELP